MASEWETYGDYVSADEKRRRADAASCKLEKKGRKLAAVRLSGRAIANSFWGKAWCQHLESYSDYASRLPRGRSYVRQGAVVDLQVQRGMIKAQVSGTRLYEVEIKIDILGKEAWTQLKKDCAGKVGSLMDLLQGKLSAPVMEIVTRKDSGLFPKPKEIHLDCSCPDRADMCKHIAAVLYGVGARLDESPELLFVLRGVDHLELIASATRSLDADLAAPLGGKVAKLDEGSLAGVFGIEIDDTVMTSVVAPKSRRSKPHASAARTKKQATPRPAKKAPASKGAPAMKTPPRVATQAAKNKPASGATPKKGQKRRAASKK